MLQTYKDTVINIKDTADWLTRPLKNQAADQWQIAPTEEVAVNEVNEQYQTDIEVVVA